MTAGDSKAEVREASIRIALKSCFPNLPAAIEKEFWAVLRNGPCGHPAVHILDKPYGSNRILRIDGDYGLSCAKLLPGQSTSLHSHRLRHEFFAVRKGSVRLMEGDGQRVLDVMDCGRSSPGIAHQLANASEYESEFVEIFSPALLDDKRRINDPYNRRVGNVSFHE